MMDEEPKIVFNQNNNSSEFSQDSSMVNLDNDVKNCKNLKRPGDYSSEEESSLCKYVKLTTSEKIVIAQEKQQLESSSSWNKVSDSLSNDTKNKHLETSTVSKNGEVKNQDIAEIPTDNFDLNLFKLVLSLKQDIQELTKKIEKQENILDAVVHANEINLTPLLAQNFEEKYNLVLPFSSVDEFDKFNQDLVRDTKFCNEFITSLCSYIDNNVSFSKNILTMLRKYMSKDLVMLYTASKATGCKMVLKDTCFCNCLLQATKLTLKNGLLPLEHEKAFLKSLSLVVTGAKSWNNGNERRNLSQRSYE